MVNKHLLGSLFLLCQWITLKLKIEQNNFWYFAHKMAGQSLKLGKFMNNQVANMFGQVRWPSVISTSGYELLTFFVKHFLLVVWQGSEYASVICFSLLEKIEDAKIDSVAA